MFTHSQLYFSLHGRIIFRVWICDTSRYNCKLFSFGCATFEKFSKLDSLASAHRSSGQERHIDDQLDSEDDADVSMIPSSVFVATSEESSTVSSSTRTDSSGRQKAVVHDMFSDPEKVARSDFSSLITSLTNSLNKEIAELEPDPVMDYRTNPFHPHYNVFRQRHNSKGPVLPYESSTHFVSEIPQGIPTLDFSSDDYRSSQAQLDNKYKPTDVIMGVGPNPFRNEAWTRNIQTARPNDFSAVEELKKEISAFPEETEDFEKPGEERVLSASAPTTTRKPAPCALAYPSTSFFIGLVNSALEAGLEHEGETYYFDGCCTVSIYSLLNLPILG